MEALESLVKTEDGFIVFKINFIGNKGMEGIRVKGKEKFPYRKLKELRYRLRTPNKHSEEEASMRRWLLKR